MDVSFDIRGTAGAGSFRRPVVTSSRPVPAVAAVCATVLSAWLALPSVTIAQTPPPVPSAVLVPAETTLLLPWPFDAPFGTADSNSPLVWTLTEGEAVLHVLTSINGFPSHGSGHSLDDLGESAPVQWELAPPPHGVWMEAVVVAADGVWYGYYHNEIPPPDCPGSDKIEPRLGAARSTDHGRTWVDLGIILTAPPGTVTCNTHNFYFVGGVGDFSAVLDADGQYLYLLYSQYVGAASTQGVTVARMAWADRDEPVGRVSVWNDGVWLPPWLEDASTDVSPDLAWVDGQPRYRDTDPDTRDLTGPGDLPDAGDPGETPDDGEPSSDTRPGRWVYPVATPIFPTTDSWHDGDTATAFWGPSVHWNTHLEQYVMLLNKARTVKWDQDGIYVSFAPTLDDPRAWSTPRRLLSGGRWYPQVAGTDHGTGTDKLAGETARFFMLGRSDYVIHFIRP